MTPGPSRPDDDALLRPRSDDAGTLPRGWKAVGRGAESVHVEGDTPLDDAADAEALSTGVEALDAPASDGVPDAANADGVTLSNASLLGIGVLAGVFLLYTIGWFIGAERIAPVAPVLLGGDLPFLILKWIAIAAPFVWFVVTFVLTLHSRAWVRFVWLGAGALLLVPWPLIMPFAGATSGGAQ